MISDNGKYLESLDHLRWFAAFLVFLWHSNNNFISSDFISSLSVFNFFLEGHSGVSLFFCISGFIFTFIGFGKKIDYFKFIKNRFLRIFPLIFVFLIFASLIGKVNGESALFQFFNFLGAGTPFAMWSLVVELQIYFILPVIFNYLLNINKKKILFFVLGVFIISFTMKLFFYAYENQFRTVSYWSIFGRIDQFIFGCIAGFIFKNYKIEIKNLYKYGLLLFVILLLINFYSYFRIFGGYSLISPKNIIWLFFPYFEGFLWSSLILIYCSIQSISKLSLLSNFFSYLGSISYSTYIIHIAYIHFYIWFFTNIINFNLSSSAMGLGNIFQNLIFTIQGIILKILNIDTSLSLKQQAVDGGVFFTLFFAYPILILISSIFYEIIEKPFLSMREKYLKN